jgi:hypothetical protein
MLICTNSAKKAIVSSSQIVSEKDVEWYNFKIFNIDVV